MMRKGTAIIIVLIISSIVFILTSFLIWLSKETIFSSSNLQDKLHASIKNTSLTELLKFILSTTPPTQNKIEKTLSGFTWTFKLTGEPLKGENFTIKVEDGGKFFPINSIPPDMLRRLLHEKVKDFSRVQIEVNSLIDWYDKDNFPLFGGAEEEYYKFLKHCKFKPRNSRALEAIEELHLIRGWESLPESFLREYFILSPTISINLNTAGQDMLQAVLGISPLLAKQLINLRQKKGFLTKNDIERITGISFSKLPIPFIGLHPTRVYRITIITKNGKYAHDLTRFILDCNEDERTPFRIWRWED